MFGGFQGPCSCVEGYRFEAAEGSQRFEKIGHMIRMNPPSPSTHKGAPPYTPPNAPNWVPTTPIQTPSGLSYPVSLEPSKPLPSN